MKPEDPSLKNVHVACSEEKVLDAPLRWAFGRYNLGQLTIK